MTPEDRERFAAAPVARLATVRPDGRPHLVPVVFALAGEVVWTAVDEKRKRTRRLQRLRNIEANPAVSLLVDHYEADWSRLWWVRLDGRAAVHQLEDDGAEPGLVALKEKYGQYELRPPRGPLIRIEADAWHSWQP
ncbi:MAG TPA: TIGR03668 family PPOX class F420-dependent oxidoreductase [Intrasporangium sp.]|nr:TIGR03668 family PPOX class F420-dependent oxidoreductase [Intrasporangium sp.]